MNKHKTIWMLVALLISYGISQAQEASTTFSKHSIKIGVGVGASMGSSTDGMGFMHSIGYQKEIWKDRLRLNPNFSCGYYSSKGVLDANDQYFNAINLATKLYFDLIKAKAFSVVVGSGVLLNYTKGLSGTGGDMADHTQTPSSHYISNVHFAAYMGGGFRINHPNKRLAINILPFNIHFGNNYFGELHFIFELDIKI